MKLILLQDIQNIGKKGEIKDVSDGFAMNFLLPQKKAVLATTKNVQNIKAEEKVIAKKVEVKVAVYQKIKNTLQQQTLIFAGKTSDKGHLFQAIKIADIIKATKKNFNINLEEKWLIDFVALKDLGKHQVWLQLPDNNRVLILVKIEAL